MKKLILFIALLISTATLFAQLPSNGWQPQNLQLNPSTVWKKTYVNDPGAGVVGYTYSYKTDLTINFDVPTNANSYSVTLVPSSLCSAYKTLDILYHNGSCGGLSTYNLFALPVTIGMRGQPGDSVYGVIAIYQGVKTVSVTNITLSGIQVINGIQLVAGDVVFAQGQNDTSQVANYVVASGAWTKTTSVNYGHSYSAPFKFKQPVGATDVDPAWPYFCQTTGCRETDYCKNIVAIRTGINTPPTVTITPTPNTKPIHGNPRKK